MKDELKKNIKDKIILIATALTALIGGFFIMLFLDDYFSKEWTTFISAGIGYLVILIYLPFSVSRFRRFSKLKIILFQCCVCACTVAIAAIIFKLRILPMPDRFRIYTIAIVVLAALSMTALEYCIKKWNFK